MLQRDRCDVNSLPELGLRVIILAGRRDSSRYHKVCSRRGGQHAQIAAVATSSGCASGMPRTSRLRQRWAHLGWIGSQRRVGGNRREKHPGRVGDNGRRRHQRRSWVERVDSSCIVGALNGNRVKNSCIADLLNASDVQPGHRLANRQTYAIRRRSYLARKHRQSHCRQSAPEWVGRAHDPLERHQQQPTLHPDL